ncbi:MAG: LLM class flavin-dependent oxidoreductase [Acidimicrobiia bacterium]|nr:LLM class flavin-dependent oxidoreductase [Acidimicrobiia bacterium]
MEFGLVLSQFNTRWSHVETDARAAEAVGLDSVWLADHLLGTTGAESPVFEAWTALAYLAGITERVRLGHLVNCVSFRNVGLMAKMASTLDHASGGRFELGLGAGWHEPEYTAFGYPFGSAGERRRYFEEYLDALIALFTGAPVDMAGEYITLEHAVCNPPPLQEPYPPIVVGTGGELMRRVTGAKADVWNCPAGLIPDLDAAKQVVDDAAGDRKVRTTLQIPVAVGRNREEADAALAVGRMHMAWMGDIESIGIVGTLDEAADIVAGYRARGVDGLIGVLPGSRQRPDFIAAYGELASQF